MLNHLHIENYALISGLDINFSGGLSTITGETGAGKSILLGALSLILGKRADTSVLFDKTKKCIVEGTFGIKGYGLKDVFEKHDLDYDDNTIIRREITVTGKSRAFINDVPVNLEILTELGLKLIDIHSQHQTLHLSGNNFQMKVLDIFAGNNNVLTAYRSCYHNYLSLRQQINSMSEESEKSKADLDYFRFQFKQLEDAHLKPGEKDELEQEIEKLSHAEDIRTSLSASGEIMEGEGNSLLVLLKDLISTISGPAKYIPEVEEIRQRAESTYIELKDLAREIEILKEKTSIDPERLIVLRERLDLIYSLEKKHRVSGVDALLILQENLSNKISKINNFDTELAELQKDLDSKQEDLLKLASSLNSRRKQSMPQFEEKVTIMLREMAMPGASFKITLEDNGGFTNDGTDRIQFLFSANRNSEPQDIAKVASGGELSRLMLSVKSLMSDSAGLPTVVFDEIDTGVSGEVAGKVGNIIRKMASAMQIINITHLPQIASKGDQHYLVYKDDDGNSPVTKIRQLTEDERHYEIARMLSGEEITGAALENARILLNSK